MTRNVVAYHAECTDGFAAAVAARQKLGDQETSYVAVDHNEAPSEGWHGAHLYILDFTFPRPLLVDLARRCPIVTVIDHTLTSREELMAPGVGGWVRHPDLPENVTVVFDLDKSGCVLAWAHFNGGDVPHLYRILQDYDQHRLSYAETRPVVLALRSVPYDFQAWRDYLQPGGWERLQAEGIAIQRYVDHQAKKVLAKNAITVRTSEALGHANISIANAPFFLVTEVGLALAADAPYAVVFQLIPAGSVGQVGVRVSLRSAVGRGIDVSAIARRFGGGGHEHAAAFECSLEEFEELFGLH